MSNDEHKTLSPSELHKETVKKIEHQRVILLLTGKSAENIFQAAERISENSSCLIGVDFSVDGVNSRLKSLRKEAGRKLGVFSVSTAKETRSAINSGASFVFSPLLDKRILRKCKTEKVFHAPGALTPTEVHGCDNLRADAVSIFPCSVMGGAQWLSRLKDMFPGVKFIPTDKMTPDEARGYLNAGAYAAAPIIDVRDTASPENLAYDFHKSAQ